MVDKMNLSLIGIKVKEGTEKFFPETERGFSSQFKCMLSHNFVKYPIIRNKHIYNEIGQLIIIQ